MAVWRVECDQSSGSPDSVLPLYSLSTGAYGFFRPSVVWPSVARPSASFSSSSSSSSSSCGALCGRSLLVVSCEEASVLLLLDCSSGATVARLETEQREPADEDSKALSLPSLPLSTPRFVRFRRRYGMVMCAQLYRRTGQSCAAAPSSQSTAGQCCAAGCDWYAVCGMESGHVAVFLLSVPAEGEQPHVLACPLVGELKLHDEPGQLTAILTSVHPSIHHSFQRADAV